MLSALNGSSHLICIETLKRLAIIIPILQMRKMEA